MTSSNAALLWHTTIPAIKTLDLSDAGTEKLMAFARGQRQRYLNSLPFPHLIIDNLFSPELLEAVRQDAQRLEPFERKGTAPLQTAPPVYATGPTAGQFLLSLCSAQFCRFLETLTGVEGLISDAAFEGENAGILARQRGSVTKVCPGTNWHPRLKLDRRLHMRIYLNPDWDEQWGGQLELWDSARQNQFVKIPPVFNKTVVFSTTEAAYYGYPTPLSCPDGVILRSLCLNYYSSTRRESALPPTASTAYYYPDRAGDPYINDGLRSPQMARGRSGKSTKAIQRKVTQLPQSVQKTIEKSLPKPLIKLYKAGKRSLRG
ncbi:MAG: 2OG-Fe(II) oxygenase [Phormidesmis sp.]